MDYTEDAYEKEIERYQKIYNFTREQAEKELEYQRQREEYNRREEEYQKRSKQVLDDKLASLERLVEKQRNYSKLNKTDYDAAVEARKEEIKHENELDSIKRKSIEQIIEKRKYEKEELWDKIKQKEAELKLTNYAADKKKLQEEMNVLTEAYVKKQDNITRLSNASLLTENKLLNAHKLREQLLKKMGEHFAKNAEDAKSNYEDLLRKKDAGFDISDDEIGEAKQLAQKALNKAGVGGQLINIISNLAGMLKRSLESLLQKVDNGINMYSNYKGQIDARLQTISGVTQKSFDSINETFQKSLQTTGYLSYVKLIENVDQLTKAGISYNIEERAFLATISDKMVASFNTMDASLLRMIRLQQADMTRLMLGNEATLTQLFNEYFEDTSYLATNVADNVASQVFDASATMDVENSSAFQFAVQKWLGALYEVGASDSVVGSIAQAINMLGTGQSSKFSDSPVATLLNMAIARSDFSLADVLTQGLNVDFIDEMMSSMISLLKDIKDNTTNQVTLSAYADVFGMSMSDLRAFTNLINDIPSLKSYNQSAAESKIAVDNQIRLLESRTTLKEKIDNIIQNFSYIIGENIADDTVQYITYVAGNLVRQLGSGTVAGLAGAATQLGVGAWALNEYGSKVNNGMPYFDEEGTGWSVLSALGLGWIGDIVNFFGNIKTALGTAINGFKVSELVNAPLGANVNVRYERGADFVGVMPEYGTVSSSTSRSMGMSLNKGLQLYNNMPGSTISGGDYGILVEEETGPTVKEKIASLNDIVETTAHEYISTETAESLAKSVDLQDVYTELFLNQDYPIRVHISHFDDRAMGQLKGDAHLDDDYEFLRVLETLATGVGIKADIIDSDVNSIINHIYSVRES